VIRTISVMIQHYFQSHDNQFTFLIGCPIRLRSADFSADTRATLNPPPVVSKI
jgi:hypothetical protein